eukprot:5844127-Heterocapsa_arctica.AAC.1
MGGSANCHHNQCRLCPPPHLAGLAVLIPLHTVHTRVIPVSYPFHTRFIPPFRPEQATTSKFQHVARVSVSARVDCLVSVGVSVSALLVW